MEQGQDQDQEQEELLQELDDVDTIVVRVTLQETNEILYYRVKPTTRLFKLKDNFRKTYGWPPHCLRFYFGAHEISNLDTADALGIPDNGDVIVRLNRIAMSDYEWIQQKRPVENFKTLGHFNRNDRSATIILRVVCGEIAMKMDVRMKTTSSLSLLKQEFYKLSRPPTMNFIFKYKDYVIEDTDTPAELNMGMHDKIEVTVAVDKSVVGPSSLVTMIIVHDVGVEGAWLFRMNSSFLMMDLKMNFSRTIDKPVENLCFFYRGQEVEDDLSPYELGMREINVVYVMKVEPGVDQVLFTTPPSECIPRLWAIGDSQPGKAFAYSTLGGLNELKSRFSTLSGWPLDSLRLWYKGKLIEDTDTMKSLQMEYDDVVRVTRAP